MSVDISKANVGFVTSLPTDKVLIGKANISFVSATLPGVLITKANIGFVTSPNTSSSRRRQALLGSF